MTIKVTGKRGPRHSERGVALMTALLGLLLLTTLGLALTYVSSVALTVSTNDREASQAFYIAQAGISHAIVIITNTPFWNLDNILAAGDGSSNTGDELSVQPTGYNGPAFVAIPSAGLTYAGGNYTVKVRDYTNPAPGTGAFDQKLVVTSLGSGADGSSVTLEATVYVANSLPGMLINGSFINQGNTTLLGAGGSIQANGSITLPGTLCVSQVASTSMTVDKPQNIYSGNCSGAGTLQQTQPTVSAPVFNFKTFFLPEASYVMGQDGKVYTGSTFIGDGKTVPLGGNGWGGWQWDNVNLVWSYSGNGPVPQGTYYAEGSNLKISTSWQGNPQTLTLIAEGYIDVSQSPIFIPALPGYTLVAGNDMKVSGSGGSPTQPGLIYAANQMYISGSPAYYGQIIAANVNDTAAPGGANLLGYSGNGALTINGNPTITYAGSSGGPTGITTWREVRN